MIDDKKIELLRKIQALAERGDRGEREAARVQLERLMKKYNVQAADLSDDSVSIHWFRVSGTYEVKLLDQIAFKICNHFKAYTHKSGKGMRSERGIECTDADALQIQIEFEFYNRLLNEEFLLFYRAFIHKHHIFPDDPDPDVPASELTNDEYFRMGAMMAGMKDATLLKMIGDH